MDMIEKHYKRELITLKRKHIASTTIIITTMTKVNNHFTLDKKSSTKNQKRNSKFWIYSSASN